jgi:alkylation response protein AidB-like acyl-CoA dehydrogenase
MATTGKTETGKNEISAFIMMKDQVTPVRKIHTYGMRASDTAELRFEDAKAELLGARGRGRIDSGDVTATRNATVTVLP